MATLAQLEQQFNAFQAGTKAIETLTDAEKVTIIQRLFPQGVKIDVNNSTVYVGANVYGTKAGINGGLYFEGVVLTSPPTQDSHINFTRQDG